MLLYIHVVTCTYNINVHVTSVLASVNSSHFDYLQKFFGVNDFFQKIMYTVMVQTCCFAHAQTHVAHVNWSSKG